MDDFEAILRQALQSLLYRPSNPRLPQPRDEPHNTA
jgi:hypothetical protein